MYWYYVYYLTQVSSTSLWIKDIISTSCVVTSVLLREDSDVIYAEETGTASPLHVCNNDRSSKSLLKHSGIATANHLDQRSQQQITPETIRDPIYNRNCNQKSPLKHSGITLAVIRTTCVPLPTSNKGINETCSAVFFYICVDLDRNLW